MEFTYLAIQHLILWFLIVSSSHVYIPTGPGVKHTKQEETPEEKRAER